MTAANALACISHARRANGSHLAGNRDGTPTPQDASRAVKASK